MGDKKDSNLGKEVLEKKAEGDTFPAGGGSGLRRSTRVRKLAPLPSSSPQNGGGSSVAGGRKRKEPAGDPTEVAQDGDDVKVMKSVKVGGAGIKPGETSSSSVIVNSDSKRSEEGSSVPVEEEAHPCLFIENILDVIFKHVMEQPWFRRDNDVQSIRQVCKSWRDSVTRVYRRDGPTVTFNNDSRACRSRQNLREFMETMKSSPMIPVQKFSFNHAVLTQENLKLFRDFLLICGPEVSSLTLSIQSSDAERIMLSLKDLPALNLLKLAALKLHLSEKRQNEVKTEADRVAQIVDLVQLLLKGTKKLREFDLSYVPPAHRRGQVVGMEQLGPLIATGIPRSVKQLKLRLEMQEATFNNLAEAGLELEQFEFGVPSVLGRMTLHRFLRSQAPTLKQLRIWNPRQSQDGIFVEFPPLPELIGLELQDAVVSITPPSDFGQAFPKLHRLGITGMKRREALEALLLSIIQGSSQSLKVLYLPILQNGGSLAPIVKSLAESFPSIVELHVELHHASKETLVEIFKYFDNLESLNIAFFENVWTGARAHWADSLFSGLSEADCFTIGKYRDFGGVNLTEFQRQPSLLNLTKLKKLSVDSCKDARGSVAFTDVSAHFVFPEMPNLRKIHLDRSTMRFSLSSVDLLRDRLVEGVGIGY